jgi:hypothetical protein
VKAAAAVRASKSFFIFNSPEYSVFNRDRARRGTRGLRFPKPLRTL